jgi:hypothetical protein
MTHGRIILDPTPSAVNTTTADVALVKQQKKKPFFKRNKKGGDYKPLSSIDKLINTFVDLIVEKQDSSVPEKLYKMINTSYANSTTQRDDLFSKLSNFCKKHFNLFKSLIYGKGSIEIPNMRRSKVYMDDPNEVDAEGIPFETTDTIYIEDSRGNSTLDISPNGISYASGTFIEQNGKFFVSDEKDLSEYLKLIKNILQYFSDSSEQAKKALDELKQLVLKNIENKNERSTKDKQDQD